jgi:hypothetical protein
VKAEGKQTESMRFSDKREDLSDVWSNAVVYGKTNSKLIRIISQELHTTVVNTMYDVVSKIFRPDSTIYTAVVVERSTGPNRPNCEFRILLRRFAATS